MSEPHVTAIIMETENPAETLRNEDGVFEVTSPYGHIFQVSCRRGSRMNIRALSDPEPGIQQSGTTWKIRRLQTRSAALQGKA
jgi:hypothetical protein